MLFGLDFRLSLKEFSYNITKREKTKSVIIDPNVTTIDSLITIKYLPLINNIYNKAAKNPADENQKIRNEYIIENTKLIKLLNLKSDINQGKAVDSITQKIYQIENN